MENTKIYNKVKHNQIKSERRAIKRADKRAITGEEVIFIFEKVLESWKTIKIFNTIIQMNPSSYINKKIVESVSTGNCKVYSNELSKERYDHYLELRTKVTSYF